MNRIRVAVLCFVAALFLAPQHALAQGGGGTNNLTALNARLTALEATVAAEKAARLAAEAALQNSVTAETNARASADTALQVQIDKLKGNITELDLVGTYDVYLLGISMDDPGTVQTFNEMSSYAFTGTAVFTNDLRGSLNGTLAGRVMIEQTPDQIWAADGGSFQVTGGDDGDFSWSYSNNVLTITVDDDVQFKDYALSVAGGGRVLVGASGGPPSNNQQLTVWTRRP